MAGIPEDKIQEVRDKVDIVDLVGRYVELRKAGRNFKGLCPFHDEKTPSFNVNPSRRGYKCFGCGEGGDGIAFLMEIEGKSFPEAVRKLAELFGVTLPSSGKRSDDEATRTQRDDAYAILKTAAVFYREILLDDDMGRVGREYVAQRGIDDKTAETFRLGYAPAPTEGGWDALSRRLSSLGLDAALATELGLIGASEGRSNTYDKFRGRLMFPVVAPGDEVIAFSGRVVPPHDEPAPGEDNPPPKYVNSPESLVYRKGRALYGLHAARSAIRGAGRMILVEGNVDVVALHQRGYPETVAPLGTALTAEQAHLIARFTEQVILAFDGDAAGKKAAAAALPLLLAEDLDVRIVLLPEGEDPDSVDPARFSEAVDGAQPALQVMMERLAARAGTALDAKARALDRLLPLIVKLPRKSARELYAQRASELFGVPMARLRSMVKEKTPRRGSTSRPVVPTSSPVRPASPLPDGQSQLAALLVDLPHLAGLANRHGVREVVTDERLSPIVGAILDGAETGEHPDMDSLLRLVDESVQRQIYDRVFAGSFVQTEGVDPQAQLEDVLARCQEDELRQQIAGVDREIESARMDGDPQVLATLAQRRLELVGQHQSIRDRRAQ